MSPARVVVVGASLAGATTALALRRLGFAGDVLLLGQEPHLPYERPALSKGYLAGAVDAPTLAVAPRSTYDDLAVELRLGTTAVGLDVDRREVLLAGDAAVPYDALVVATGSTNVVPPIPGLDLPGVCQLRTLDEADRLAAAAASARSVVVVGMGFIGCEVAATLRTRGLEVTMVDPAPGPLAVQLGPELSARVRGWHESHGVRLLAGAAVAAVEGQAAVERVRLADGRVLPADVVVVGVGARPATGWLADAALHQVHGAIGVDELGRSSAPGVWAAGDVASSWDPGTRSHRRTQHYRTAVDQGTLVAHGILGLPAPPASASWFWSDQYDHVVHYAGDREGAVLHERTDPHLGFFTRGSTLTAVAAVDNGRGFRRALRLLGHDVDPSSLVDADVDLRTLEAAPAAVAS